MVFRQYEDMIRCVLQTELLVLNWLDKPAWMGSIYNVGIAKQCTLWRSEIWRYYPLKNHSASFSRSHCKIGFSKGPIFIAY